MRDLYTVITQLLEVIPTGESELIRKLQGVQTKILYAAPETHGYHFRLTASILERHSLDKDEHWLKSHSQSLTTIPHYSTSLFLRKLSCRLNYWINKIISAFGLCPKCFKGLSANKHQLFCTNPDCKFRTSKIF